MTIADRGAEEAMRNASCASSRSTGVLGEEFGWHQPDAHQWVLDPIDGTKNFVAGSYSPSVRSSRWCATVGLCSG
ncbi:MAG: inositol monophosphatase family protein [Caldilineaceae bacterium]